MVVTRVLAIGLCLLGNGMATFAVPWTRLVPCRMILRMVLLTVSLGENTTTEWMSLVGRLK